MLERTAKETARKEQWKKDNIEKRSAHNIVRNAIRKGELVPETCEKCGRAIVEGHHDDYSKPLEVRWLCPKHHREIHK